MNSRKVEDLLKKVSPPDVSLPSSKTKLRRDLLNHPRFNPKPSWFRRMFPRMVLAGGPLVVLVLVVFIIKMIPDEMSAHARLQDLETTYRHSLVKDRVHYTKTRFESSQEKDSKLLLEQWRYKNDALRIMLQREKTGEYISHLIVKGERIFLYNDQEAGAKIRASQSCVKTPQEQETKTTTPTKNQHAYSVSITPLADKNGKKRANVIISRDAFDIFGFASQAPGDIFSRLQADPDVSYAGTENHDGLVLEIFQRKSSPTIVSYLLEYKGDLDKEVKQLIQTMKEGEITSGRELDGFKIQRIDVVETLKVYRHDGHIASLTRRSSENGKSIASHELQFLVDEFLTYSPALFDQFAFGLHDFEITNKDMNK